MMAGEKRAEWRQEFADLDLADLRRQRFRDSRFRNCRFQRLTSAVLERCSLERCSLEPESLLDLLGVTLTLDCFTFDGLELNERALDALLWLAAMTRGNDRKRELLKQLINPRHSEEFVEQFERLTRR